MNYKNIIILILAVALLVFGGLYIFSPKPVENLGIGEVTGEQWWAVTHAHEGMYFGTGRQASIDRSGAIVTSGGITNTGAFTGTTGTFSSTLGVTGAFTGTSGAFSTTLAVVGETNLQRLIQGGTKTTLTATSTATTLTAAQVCNSSIIQWDVSGTSSTLTMASTSLVVADCATQTGDRFGFYLDNISGSGENITIVTNSGNMTLKEPSGGDVVIVYTETAYIEYIITLASSTDSTSDVIVTSLQEAD